MIVQVFSQVKGDLPFPKCKVALDSVVFSVEQQSDEMGSVLADAIAHMGLDVSFLLFVCSILDCHGYIYLETLISFAGQLTS